MVAMVGVVAGLGLGACGSDGGGGGPAQDGDSSSCSGADDLVVLTDGFNGEATIEVLDPGATDLRRISGDQTTTKPSLSPDGRSVVVVHAEGDYESAGPDATALWVLPVDGDGKPLRELTDGASSVDEPAWSPDGTSIAFRERSGDVSRIMVVDAAGGEPEELVAPSDGGDFLPAWSPDGSRLAFVRNVAGPSSERPPAAELWSVAADGTDLMRVAALDRWTSSLAWNPDGRSILVGAEEHGLFEVAADGGSQPVQVADSGTLPAWSSDGQRLYLTMLLTDDDASDVDDVEPMPTEPGDPTQDDEDHHWAVVEATLADGVVTAGRTLLEYAYLYSYYGTSVGPCRPGST